METRRLEPCDAQIAQGLVRKFYDKAVSEARMSRLLSNTANFLLVAEEDGAVVGCLSAHQIDSLLEDAAAMFIYDVDVEEAHRRQGVGAALIKHIRRLADENGMFEMFVFTNHSNPGAVAFYQATGGQVEEGDELMFVYPLAKKGGLA